MFIKLIFLYILHELCMSSSIFYTYKAGEKEVRKSLRSIIWIKYKIKDNDVFEKAYSYIEQYY